MFYLTLDRIDVSFKFCLQFGCLYSVLFREQCNADKERNSFKWFMDNVAYDLPKYYPRPHKNIIWGEVCSFAKCSKESANFKLSLH